MDGALSAVMHNKLVTLCHILWLCGTGCAKHHSLSGDARTPDAAVVDSDGSAASLDATSGLPADAGLMGPDSGRPNDCPLSPTAYCIDPGPTPGSRRVSVLVSECTCESDAQCTANINSGTMDIQTGFCDEPSPCADCRPLWATCELPSTGAAPLPLRINGQILANTTIDPSKTMCRSLSRSRCDENFGSWGAQHVTQVIDSCRADVHHGNFVLIESTACGPCPSSQGHCDVTLGSTGADQWQLQLDVHHHFECSACGDPSTSTTDDCTTVESVCWLPDLPAETQDDIRLVRTGSTSGIIEEVFCD